ncbi:hypothetical protein AC578_9866 [Pseudocercospora eumusae]|uniref:Uncharacterized protein n=1 Tax=Pseudocercospora eumusae TaxID=321146 RepID=A0A139HB75_9PEZI|nr:hypothetical protein AC578_9866 [Pseudocercospora eumusae]
MSRQEHNQCKSPGDAFTSRGSSKDRSSAVSLSPLYDGKDTSQRANDEHTLPVAWDEWAL